MQEWRWCVAYDVVRKPPSSCSPARNTRSCGTNTSSKITTPVDCPYFAENFAAASPGRPAGRATMVTPAASTGTAQHTAHAPSSAVWVRHGITRNSCMYGAPVTIALVPRMMMPSGRRSVMCT